MGSTHRQKVTSKVIFLLHCTGLAQLSFYTSLVGAYNFTLCNHTAIKTNYQNILQKIISMELKKRKINTQIKNCCTTESEASLLGCIYHFTKDTFPTLKIWNVTNTLLRKNCHGNSEVNGSQNQQWIIPNCNRTPKPLRNITVFLELREMWYSYESYEILNWK